MQARKKHDVIIVGGGPAGAASAMFLLQAGIKPVIVEKVQFPRYHIGEAMPGECAGLLRGLGLERRLLAEGYPIKNGGKVWGTGGKRSFFVEAAARTPDNRLRPTWAWQVRRSTFDKILLDAAIERGAELLPCEAVAPLVAGDRVTGLRIRTPQGATEDLSSEVLIDASGMATFLCNRGLTSPKERGLYDKQVAIFSQVPGAICKSDEGDNNTLIFYRQKYHWAWLIPLNGGVTSIGVVAPSEYFKAQKLAQPDYLKLEMSTLNPELTKRVPDTTFVDEVRGISNFSYHIRHFTGQGFLCVGDSHRFIDPIFAFGLYLAIKEAQFASQAIEKFLAGETRDAANPFADYELLVDRGQDLFQDMIDCFWNFPLPFLLFVHYKYHEDLVDFFAGRVYSDEAQKQPGIVAMRRLLAIRSRGQAPPAE
jgi:flavin-dependent dehydrogenase